jgi:3',5'-cyclic AMP phosphodiesterase CpdA
MRLLATSDLHISHRTNREALTDIGNYPDDWLIVAGDIGERPEHLRYALDVLIPRFSRIIWAPGNHDLWCPVHATDRTRGEARYHELLEICRTRGVITPEDPYEEWPASPGTYLVPMFLLFDYSFRPAAVPEDGAVAWARERGVMSGDEYLLSPEPYASRADWCRARCDLTAARLDALPAGARTVLVNHWPLRYDLARPPRVPRFSLWCGTTRTEGWARRYRARAVVTGHLHLRSTLWRDGVRYEEVSLGYPRDWQPSRGIDAYLRPILPDDDTATPPAASHRDPFL